MSRLLERFVDYFPFFVSLYRITLFFSHIVSFTVLLCHSLKLSPFSLSFRPDCTFPIARGEQLDSRRATSSSAARW